MCGIAGLVNWGGREIVRHMTDVQAHRGPDDSGVWEKRLPDGTHVTLGSTRLAILDLSSGGHMPMPNEDGMVWITYNGEIYNFRALRAELVSKGHRFRSHTDTEVVLHLYEEEGPDCVRRLNGMFAFAICDLRAGKPVLFLARDHFGIKPLYYAHQGSRLAFASEVKALLEVPHLSAEMDLEALHQYLTFLWVPDPKTMFRGILKLPAGHYATFCDGRMQITQYWDLTFPPADAVYSWSESELCTEIRERFAHSVRSQLVSDVPVGAFLSAGLDSSSIVATMGAVNATPLRTYTVTFPSQYRVGETTLDDASVASRFARKLGCEHHEIVVEPDVANLLPRLIWHMDEPAADPAILTSYMVCREAREHSTVLLSGVGGDELFAGYRKYQAHYVAEAYRKVPSKVGAAIEAGILRLPAFRGRSFKGRIRLAKKMARSASLSPVDRFLANCTYLSTNEKSALYSSELASVAGALDPALEHRKRFAEISHSDFLHQMLYLDTKIFMTSLNLTYNDKMSMASSVEVRVPFLDREFAEFVAWNVPPHLKLKGQFGRETKYILRKAMKGILPDEVLRQPKAGFAAPVDYWLANDLQQMVDDLLSPSRIRQRGLFRPEAVRKFVHEHRNGVHDWSMQIWQFLTLELWMQTFIDACGNPLNRSQMPVEIATA